MWCTRNSRCLHMCVAGGYAAGKHAPDFADLSGKLRPLDAGEIEEEKDRVFRPLYKKQGLFYHGLDDAVRIVITDHFGPVKTENSLTRALEKLDRLDAAREDLMARNLHELMRVHEAMNIHQVAKITAHAALARRETRVSPYHYRADFTEMDNENFCGLIVVKKGPEGKARMRFEPLTYKI